MRIVELIELPRRPGRFALMLEDGRKLTLSASILAEHGATRVGAVLTAVTIAHLEFEALVLKAMDRALGILARGRRTRRELEQRLRRLLIDALAIATALDRLTATGLLSDQAVARAEASARLRRGEAAYRVKRVLQQKGVDRSDAEAAVAFAVREDGIDENVQCLEVAERRMRSLAELDAVVARRRLGAFLSRRGFGAQAIRQALAAHFGTR